MDLNFELLKDVYSICRYEAGSAIPNRIVQSDFFSVTGTHDELSVVCKQSDLIPDKKLKTDKNWKILKIEGQLDLSLVGVIADLSQLFQKNGIPLFIVSTFNTDYILVKTYHIDKAIEVLESAGHKIYIAQI